MINYREEIAPLSGWLTRREAEFLYRLAFQIKNPKVIVEIGSWKGKSTVCLGRGVQAGHKAKIFAIDPHVGSSEHQRKFGKVDTFKEFLQNIKKAKVEKNISPIRDYSQNVADKFKEKIGFLFIDGAHEFKYVYQDYKQWFPKLENNGIISFHDSWHFPGPHLVILGLALFSSRVRMAGLADTITYFQKVRKNSFFDRLRNIAFCFYHFFAGFLGFLRLKYFGSTVVRKK